MFIYNIPLFTLLKGIVFRTLSKKKKLLCLLLHTCN
jgi:hypothetical protein